MEKKVVSDKNRLFSATETECHHIRVEPESDEYLKVWISEPTWLQVEQALSTVLKVDAQNQSLDLDMNEMYKFMVENFVEKTEPHLSKLELMRLSPYLGGQLKDILPNPFNDLLGDEQGKE